MNFLAPLFLFGALAVTLPILFHLVRRTAQERIPFSTLMFLQPTPPRVTRRSRLEHLLLLLARCLVLCLLALGFARPWWHRMLSTPQPASPGKRMILLVDTSASMRRERLWPEAQARVETLLQKTRPADHVAIFTFDRQTRPLVTFEQWAAAAPGERVALARKRLAEVTPGWSATHLGAALITAAEALEFATGRQTPGQSDAAGEIVVVSDLQEGSRLEGLQGYEWPAGISLAIERLAAKHLSNAGLQWVTQSDESSSAAADPGPRLRIYNAADSKKEQFQIRWLDDVTARVAAGGPAPDLYVPAGQNRIVPAPKMLAGWTGDRLQLIGDEDDFDNVVYCLPPPIQHLRVVYYGAERDNDPGQPLYYLKRAFQETRKHFVHLVPNPPGSPLLLSETNQAQLLIINDTAPPDQLPAIRQFLAAGKGGVLVLNSTAGAATLGGVLGLGGITAEEASTNIYAMLGQIDFEHPLLAPFADPRFSDFTKIHFWKHRRLATNSLPNARILGRFDNGDAAILQVPIGQGSLLVFTFGWHPADSQWVLSSKFVPLLYSILEQSTPLKPPELQYAVGDPVNLASLSDSAPLKIQKPDRSIVELPRDNRVFSQTDQPGIYTVTSVQPEHRFAVNLAAEESKTSVLPQENLERLGVPLRLPGVDLAKFAEHQSQLRQAAELENQQKLWRWLILSAMLVLILETGLAGWLTRRANTQPQVQV